MWYNGGMKIKWLVGILRYGLGLLIALLIFWGFYGFIKDDNWLAVSALATLILAVAAFISVRQVNVNQKRERRERLLNEIIDWATDVRKYASILHIIDQPSYQRMMSADRFFTLKYNGKKFLIAVKKQAIGDDLQSLLSNAIDFLDKNWRDLATKACRRGEIGKDLDKIGETIIEKAEDLLSSNS